MKKVAAELVKLAKELMAGNFGAFINEHKKTFGDKGKPEHKDYERIENMIAKSKANVAKSGTTNFAFEMKTFAENMAKSIDGAEKAFRRGLAAYEYSKKTMFSAGEKDILKKVSDIFFDRVKELE